MHEDFEQRPRFSNGRNQLNPPESNPLTGSGFYRSNQQSYQSVESKMEPKMKDITPSKKGTLLIEGENE